MLKFTLWYECIDSPMTKQILENMEGTKNNS